MVFQMQFIKKTNNSGVGFSALCINKLLKVQYRNRGGAAFYSLYKSDLRSDAQNYRLIALIDTEAKIYVTRLLQDLEDWVTQNRIIPLTQTGFRPGSSTYINLLAVSLLIE